MIVDDTPANLRLLEVMLLEKNFRVLSFPRADMALKAAGRNPPDLVLLDITMPEMDG
jgi:DNA-binding response OmpR family regulator